MRTAQTIAGLVKEKFDPVVPKINDINRTGAIDISKADASLVEEIRSIEPGSVIHGHLSPKASIAQVRPVAYLTIANTQQVGQSVATHVCQVHRLLSIREDERGTFFLVPAFVRALPRAKASLSSRRIPGEDFLLGDQNVNKPIARQINETQVGVCPVDIRERSKCSEWIPSAFFSTFIESRYRTSILH